jgi:hypothetical protein
MEAWERSLKLGRAGKEVASAKTTLANPKRPALKTAQSYGVQN